MRHRALARQAVPGRQAGDEGLRQQQRVRCSSAGTRLRVDEADVQPVVQQLGDLFARVELGQRDAHRRMPGLEACASACGRPR